MMRPILVKDVANVELAPLATGSGHSGWPGRNCDRHGAYATGEKTPAPSRHGKARLKEIATTLPSDVSIEILYDRGAAQLAGRWKRLFTICLKVAFWW
ncbi:MAG: hypothetical protein U0894_11035 [Pirellulales bacterium]